MMLKLHFTLIALLLATLLLGCNGCEVSRSDNGGENPSVKSGTGSPDSTSPVEPANKDGWLVSTNPDGLELKVKAEKTGKESFKIHYVLSNNGSKPIYRVVPNDLYGEGTMPGYFFLIRPFDVACGEKGARKFLDDPFRSEIPEGVKADELVILFGLDAPLNRLIEGHDWADYKEVGAGKSISGSVDIQFPVKKTSRFGVIDGGCGEDEIYEMAKNESGAPCVVAFAYGDQPLPVEMAYWGGKLIQSQRLILKIGDE